MAFEIAVVLGLLGVTWIIYTISKDMKDEFRALKLLLFFVTFFLLLLDISVVTNIATNDVPPAHANILTNLEIFYTTTLYALSFVISIVVLIYFFDKIKGIGK